MFIMLLKTLNYANLSYHYENEWKPMDAWTETVDTFLKMLNGKLWR